MAGFKTMNAKFAGKCRSCGCRIEAGDKIRWSKAAGANCFDQNDCRDWADMEAEQAAEMRMESWADHRMAGTSASFWEDEDYERSQRRRDEAEYQRGYHEVAQIQAFAPAGSALREQMYAEMEMAAYNRGEDY